MNDVTIRRAGPADAAAIRALTLAAYGKWVPIIGREPRPMLADYDRAVLEHRIDLAESAGQLDALIEMKVETDHLLIVNLAVAPAQQGRGLGRRLLAHAEDVARQSGLFELRLFTNRLMAENVVLYRRKGYGIVREEEFAPGSVAVHMSKFLDGAGAKG